MQTAFAFAQQVHQLVYFPHLISVRSDLLHHATVLSYCAVLMIYCGRKIDRLFFFSFSGRITFFDSSSVKFVNVN